MNDSLMSALKNGTSEQHEQLHQIVDLDSAFANVASYTQSLRRYLKAIAPLEQQLRECTERCQLGDLQWGERLTKANWLRQDLETLGCPVFVSWAEQDRIDNLAQFIGSTYVVEGMTWGGRYIAKVLQDRLGVNRDSGGRFFAGYGDETGERWTAFRVWCEHQSCDRSACVDAAQNVFRYFAEHLSASN